MHKAIIFSVPGTGTRFCKKFLEDVLGYQAAPSMSELNASLKNFYYQVHANKNSRNEIIFEPDIKLVTPIRDPYLSYITKNLSAPNAQRLPEYMKIWEEYWKSLINTTPSHPTVFLPVNCDEASRLSILESVVHHLGARVENKLLIEYANEWPIVDSKGMNKVKQEYLDQGTIDGKIPHFLDFAIEWQEYMI